MQKCMEIDLKQDKALSVFLNVASLLVAAAMLAPVCLNGSLSLSKYYTDMMDGNVSIGESLFQVIALIALVVCHEALHGCFMRLFGAAKLNCGINIKNAYMGCECFFPKNEYICISLAPVVVISIILLVALFCVTQKWAWFVYLLLSLNISGATGDIYVFRKVCCLPARAIIKDTGLKATAYIDNRPKNGSDFNHRIKSNTDIS